jgi:hypothetical protein
VIRLGILMVRGIFERIKVEIFYVITMETGI